MHNRTVSVIIPFYNNVDWLTEAIESVLNQTLKPLEIIVINDGSAEDLNLFLKKYQKYITYIKKKNEGPAIARNIGINTSKGDYIAFLDSDDIWLPNKLEIQITQMNKEKYVWSQTSYYTFKDGENHEEEYMTLINTSDFKGYTYPLVLASSPLATPCIIVDGPIIRKNKGLRFNPDMRHGQDSYLWINLALKYPLLTIKNPLSLVRMRGTNASKRAKVQLKAKAIIWDIINNNKDKYNAGNLSLILKFAFTLSKSGNRIVSKSERFINSSYLIELLSRFIYVLPWVMFKIYAKTLRKKF